MTAILNQLREHFLDFMMDQNNASTFTFDKLWEIEFNEGGKITMEWNELWISGDNGRCKLTELTIND